MNEKTIAARPRRSGESVLHQLVVARGDGRGTRFELARSVQTVGRSQSADLRLDDPTVSGLHCRITRVADVFLVHDLESSNGTYIDGERVDDATVLRSGAGLQLGDTLLRYEVLSDAEARAEQDEREDLDRAAAYVRALLPAPLDTGPIHTRWSLVPSARLGGDALGYHWLDDRRWAVYLIDVCGHGTAAALHTVSVVNVLRNRTLPDVDFAEPGSVLAGLNTAFRMEDHADMYFTAWYGVIDIAARRLSFSSAGHHPALLVSERDEVGRRLRTRNPAVGMMEGLEFDSETLEGIEQCRLFLFSDGVFEISLADGREATLGEFFDLLGTPGVRTSADPVAEVERRMREANQQREFEDDFTMLLVDFR